MNPLVAYGITYAGGKLLDSLFGGGGSSSYQASPEAKAYYQKVMQILNNPQGFGLSDTEMAQAMDAAQMEGTQQMRQAGADYSTWAARRGIEGGSEAKMRIKLMQEMMRNMMRTRTNLNTYNAQARTQARLAAMGALGQASGQMENANLASYQQRMQEQMQDEQFASIPISYMMQKYMAGQQAVPTTVAGTIGSTYDPRVVNNPRGIY
jgi:hypothetical protein